MDSFNQRNTTDIDIATIAIGFSSLYSALQRNYEGNNTPSIITELLHMYQTENNILAYERVLRKVQDLLEGCNPQKSQLLLSMIPIPKNTPDYTIQDVFHKTTGFIKLELQNNASQNTFGITNVDSIIDNNILSSKQNFSYDKNTSDSKSSFAEIFPFRGFAESEISTFCSHNSARRINRQANSSSDNSRNCLERNNQYQASTYRQYLLNKRYYAPARISSTDESHLSFSSQMTHGDTEITGDKISRQFNDIRYESKKCDSNVFDKNIKSVIDVGQNGTTIERTIKDKIHRMDVCWNEDDIVIDADDFLVAVSDGLKASLSNFLKRAQEGTVVELSAFPRIGSYSQTDSSIYFASEHREPATVREVSEKIGFIDGDEKSYLLLQRQNANINSGKNNRTSDERTRQKTFSHDVSAGSQTKRGFRELDKAIESAFSRDDPDYIKKRREALTRREKHDKKESMHGCKTIRAKSNDVNSESIFQARSMSEIAAYKKQYYDTLLSVQRAKVAVTNSLAFSSDRLMAYDNPYYSSYAYQQQHLFQRQRRCAMGSQFSLSYPPAVPSGLPGAHDDQYSRTRSNCKYLLLKQLRLRRQISPAYARNQG